MLARAIPTRDEYHLRIKQNVDALKARLNLPSFFASEQERGKVLYYYMERAVQIGMACFRISEFQMPLLVLALVLCEDFFTLYWASRSEEHTAEYVKSPGAGDHRIVLRNVQ